MHFRREVARSWAKRSRLHRRYGPTSDEQEIIPRVLAGLSPQMCSGPLHSARAESSARGLPYICSSSSSSSSLCRHTIVRATAFHLHILYTLPHAGVASCVRQCRRGRELGTLHAYSLPIAACGRHLVVVRLRARRGARLAREPASHAGMRHPASPVRGIAAASAVRREVPVRSGWSSGMERGRMAER